MTCDRAQEFFSAYVEEGLEHPMAVALEAHFEGCAGCRRELQSLRTVWEALDSAPVVEPPRDLACQVLLHVRQARLEQLEAERRPSVDFWGWLRGWRPARVAAVAGLATFIVASFWVWPVLNDNRIWHGWPPRQQQGAPVAIQLAVRPLAADAGSQRFRVEASTEPFLRDGELVVNGEAAPLSTGAVEVSMAPGPGLVRVFEVRVRSEQRNLDALYHCWVPLTTGAPHATISLPRREYTLAEAAAALVPQIGQPIIIEAGLEERTADLLLVGTPALDAIAELADQFGVRWFRDEGGNHLSAP